MSEFPREVVGGCLLFDIFKVRIDSSSTERKLHMSVKSMSKTRSNYHMNKCNQPSFTERFGIRNAFFSCCRSPLFKQVPTNISKHHY